MGKQNPKFKDIFTTIRDDMREGTKKINADFKRDAKSAIGEFNDTEKRKATTKTGWQLFGLVLMLPLFFLGLFFLFFAGALLWDVIFGL